MANAFKRAGTAVINSPHVITVFAVFFVGLLTSAAIMFEDYSTSRLGYEALPTLKANAWIVPVVAWLPQLAQAIFAYNFLFDTKRRWSLFIAITCLAFDIGTDVYFKSNHLQSPEMVVLALFESIVVYTFGSEILFTVSFGMVITLFPRFWEEFAKFLENFLTAFGGFLRIVAGAVGGLFAAGAKGMFSDDGDSAVEMPKKIKTPNIPQKSRKGGRETFDDYGADPLSEFRSKMNNEIA